MDTATEACTAALLIDGEIGERFEVAPRGHARLLLPMIESLLSEAGTGLRALDAVVLGRGPGSFTGVRIATGVAQGLAFAADLPVVPVSTLAALAQGVARRRDATHVLAAFDARMQELYWGCYVRGEEGRVVLQGSEQVSAVEAVVPPGGSDAWFGAGSGWAAYGEILRARLGDRLAGVEGTCLPHGVDLARLGAAAFAAGLGVAPEQALPVYLRDRVTAGA